MAEAIVGPLLSKLQDVVATEAKALAAVGGEIEKLSDKLMWLQALVYETDLRCRHDGSRLVRVLACQIREVAFEAEDAVDQFYLKCDLSRRFGLTQRFGRNWGRAALEFIANFRTHICVRFILSSRIQSMNARLDEIANNSSKYSMGQGSSAAGMTWRASRAIPPMRDNWENSVQFKLICTAKVNDELREKLLHRKEQNVIHICGVGGIGKRALLRFASEDTSIKRHFPVRVRMSFPPSISGDSSIIVQQIKEKLDKEWSWSNKTYHGNASCLVVIDSPISTTTWSEVEPQLLQMAGEASKILLSGTSRHEGNNGSSSIKLRLLDNSHSITLFNLVYGLGGRRGTIYQTREMNKIRLRIMEITNGLPLAIVLLAKLMRTMDLSKWEAASEYLKSNNEDSKLKTILSVCVDDLPDELKSCLLYTAGFPVNRVIDARQLVRLWMAEGFLTQQQGMEAEQLGQCYLKELIYWGLLQLIHKTSSADGGCVESVMIHDQIHHLLTLEAQRTSFMDFHYGGWVPPAATTRRLTLYNYNDKLSDLNSCLDKLRTVVSYSDAVKDCWWESGPKGAVANKDHDKGSEIENKSCKKEHTLMRKVLHGSPFLRVIHLERLNLGPELPDQIGEMVHLQYLRVRHQGLKKLPSSVGNLGSLQTVDVRGTEVRELPKSLWKIKTLRHVLGDRLKFPKSTGDLKFMQTLETVTIQHVRMWCTATYKRGKQFGLHFLCRLRIVELKESQQEELETILKDLSYLESLGLSGDDIPIELFADASSVVGACLDHVVSLELDGKLLLHVTPGDPRCLSSLTRLVLRRTSIKQDFIHVIAKLPTLAELEMQSGSYVGEEVVFCNHDGFNSLAVLRIIGLVTLKRIRVHSVSTMRNKAFEPIFIDMHMAKFDTFAPNTSCSFCHNTIITDQADVWQHPPAVANNQPNGGKDNLSRNDQRHTGGEAHKQAAPMAPLPSYREMILAAIDNNKKSKNAILQYINKNCLQLAAEKEIEEQLEKNEGVRRPHREQDRLLTTQTLKLCAEKLYCKFSATAPLT